MAKGTAYLKQNEIEKFLTTTFHKKISNIKHIQEGFEGSSLVYSFDRNGQTFIIRFNTVDAPFRKDLYAYLSFHNQKKLPIPPVLTIGECNNQYFFTISEKVDGLTLDEISDEAYKKIFPSLFSTLKYIHSIKIEKESKFGEWDNNGIGKWISWKSYLLDTSLHHEGESWDILLKKPMLSKDLFESIIADLQILIPLCPEKQDLLHGDYGFNSIIVKNNKIKAVLDWGQSMYGDYLFDIAWLDFWGPYDFLKLFDQLYCSIESVPFFNERIRCYKLFIGLNALNYFARGDNQAGYKKTENLLKALL